MKKPGSNVKSGWPYHSSRNPNGLRGEWAWVKMFFPAWKKKKKRLQKLQMLMMISAGEEEMAWWRMRSLSRYWDNWPWTSQGTEAALSSERGIPSFGSRPICGAWRDIRVYARTPVLWVSGSWWSGLPLTKCEKGDKDHGDGGRRMVLKLCFSTEGRFGSVWSHFGLSQLGRGCYWRLVGGGQGCCSTSSSVQRSPPPPRTHPRMIWAKYQWCRGGETCSLGFFKAKLSQICFPVPVIDSMPDTAKRRGDAPRLWLPSL